MLFDMLKAKPLVIPEVINRFRRFICAFFHAAIRLTHFITYLCAPVAALSLAFCASHGYILPENNVTTSLDIYQI